MRRPGYLDQLLDVVVAGDRKTWRWKDEDEFDDAVRVGLMDRSKALELRMAAKEAIEQIRFSRPPYTDEWRTWRPEAGWTLPELPNGWEIVPESSRS